MKKELDRYDDDSVYETIDVVETRDSNFNLGRAHTYITRAAQNTESPISDIKKARWYLEREILMLERESIDWNCDRGQLRDLGDRHNF